MDYEKKIITAKDASTAAKTPTRLLNVILRNIKETAAMGKRYFYFSDDNICEEALDYLSKELTNLGFEVKVASTSNSIDDDFAEASTITFTRIEINW